MKILSYIAITLYMVSVMGLLIYGLNCYVMVFLFQRSRKRARKKQNEIRSRYGNLLSCDSLPVITTQIPVFNELNVIERIMRSACKMQYPKDKHEIQVLDDSTDETSELINRLITELKRKGHDIYAVRRKNRTGFKAGALAEGFKRAKGEMIAVFDADFVPPEDYLIRAVPFLMADPKIGFVQARWGHLNRRRSFLTRVQSIGIDGHFMIEQGARDWNNLFMNFNGTAGIWRKRAIEDGGLWQWDTLTEDLDLSYRVQFAGWQTCYLPDLIVPAEIPEDINAFKSQQFRWAKGSMQTAKKLFPQIINAPVPVFKKIQAFLHLTHYAVHPLMVILSLLALPVLLTLEMNLSPLIFTLFAAILVLSIMAPNTLYVFSQYVAYRDWHRRIIYLPFLVVLGVGIAVSNSKAVFEAIVGRESGFVRTPKRGDNELKTYRIKFPILALFEIILGIYCALSLGFYLSSGKYLVGPFIAIYTAGFLFTGLLTFFHIFRFSR